MQAGCQEFDSPMLHAYETPGNYLSGVFPYFGAHGFSQIRHARLAIIGLPMLAFLCVNGLAKAFKNNNLDSSAGLFFFELPHGRRRFHLKRRYPHKRPAHNKSPHPHGGIVRGVALGLIAYRLWALRGNSAVDGLDFPIAFAPGDLVALIAVIWYYRANR